tara:strand:+ start:175 stop:1530 length:1356 start_codon:yes stop_codon:yes gene_type:complete
LIREQSYKISVIGLGKLGCPMLAIFADKGYETIGVDLNSKIVDFINQGKAPFKETNLQNLINKNKGKIKATTDLRKAILSTDICFIIVPTPSGENFYFKNNFILSAVKSIGEVLREKSGYFNVVITSTVMPGSTGSVIKDALEYSSGRKIGPKLGLCYNPEFIALGTVVRDMLNPDMLLIGESDTKAGDMLEEIYSNTVESNPVCHRMNWINAELCKIAVNTFVTTKISYANMIADMCDHLEEADCNVVTEAVGADSRIGNKYLKGGLGYGGPCFPRDNKAFSALGKNLGVRIDLAEATDSINDYQTKRLMKIITSKVPSGSVISILGISYKPNTPVFDESQGLALAKELIKANYIVKLSDPQAFQNLNAKDNLMSQNFLPLEEALKLAEVIVIMIPWNEYLDINFLKFHPSCIIDPWHIINPQNINKETNLIQTGIGNWKFKEKASSGDS